MDNQGAVYNRTTESNPPGKKGWFNIADMGRVHFILKVLQLVLSFVAFICEEIIDQCENCAGLYFFEFVSFSVFLLVILILVLYCTPLNIKVNKDTFCKIDWWITVGCFVSLLLASIVFAATMDITVLARTSVVFGFLASVAFGVDLFFMWRNGQRPFVKKPSVNGTTGGAEGQPLNNPVQVQGNANETV
ncbi:CKLF-like MARVEL transmembrane domain-containing protein 6 [Ascaphus truei]|uniref:CKLF-like MARVEL transmembrane domain-containing protein 6 n=1 Tax=Ascaphus truei TaxID=8439 RepID=UPI003F5950D1